MDRRTKLKYAAVGVAALVLAAGVGAVTALATANALEDDDARFARSEEPRTVIPDLNERMPDDRAPFGFGSPLRFEGWLDLEEAADYLELSVEDLHEELADGKTLADIARDEGKSVDGLVQALVQTAEERIDEAVDAGRLSEEQGEELKQDLENRIQDRVNDEFPLPKPFWLDRDFEQPRGFTG